MRRTAQARGQQDRLRVVRAMHFVVHAIFCQHARWLQSQPVRQASRGRTGCSSGLACRRGNTRHRPC
jgi:hypothetical protein